MSTFSSRAAVVLSGLLACARPPAPTEHHIVVELTSDDPAAWSAMLNNVENAQQALGRARVEVVAHGPGSSCSSLRRTQSSPSG